MQVLVSAVGLNVIFTYNHLLTELQCQLCSSKPDKGSYISHLNSFHRKRTGISLNCPFGGEESCDKTFTSVSGLSNHYYSYHYERKSLSSSSDMQSESSVTAAAEDNQEVHECPLVITEGVTAQSEESLTSVTAEVYEQQEKLATSESAEAISECSSSTIPSQLVTDSSQTASIEFSDAAIPSQLVIDSSRRGRKRPHAVEEPEDFEQEELSDEEADDEVTAAFPEEISVPVKFDTINTCAADLVLFMKDQCTVPQTAIDGVLQHCETLIRKQLSAFSDEVASVLASNNLKLENFLHVSETIDKYSDAFKGIRTKWLQESYFNQKYKVVKPLRIFLGRTLKRKRRRLTAVRETVMIENSVVCNPVTPFLEKLVKHPDYETVTNKSLFNPSDEVLDSFIKSERFKKSEFFRLHPQALRLLLYYDEFDSCDAIAAKAGLHKQGGFYLTLENIHPCYRSNLEFVTLVALVNANTLKDVGMDAVLKPILRELEKLEDGFVMENGDKLYASVIAVIGDNLGVHQLCGFKEGFTAHRTCHHCMADPSELHSMTTEKVELLRTIPQYEEQVKKLSDATTKKKREELSTEFGLNRESSLNKLKTFHVIGSVVAEEMHDLWEGLLPIQMKKLLNHLIYDENPVMTLDWLNEAISDFDYEYSESLNKPSVIRKSHVNDKDGKLHQSSAQTLFLATYLPLILGPHVEDDDPHWENFLLLVEISRLVFTPDISKSMVYYLSELIESYLSNYIKLYGDLIPKQHFMVHYPRLILENGSLTIYSCMRMEAFHRRFKREAYSIGNYLSLSASLAKSHALHQAVLLSKPLVKGMIYGPVQKRRLETTNYQHLVTGSEEVVESKWVTHQGVTYIPDRCYVVTNFKDYMPSFALVKHVIIWPELLFICENTETVAHDPNMSAYEVKKMDPALLVVVKPSQLLGHSVFHKHVVESKNYIVTKYCIGEGSCF